MRWIWIRIREGTRWILRGTMFDKLENDISRMAEPLSHQGLSEKQAEKVRAKICHAISWLPPDRAEKFHDMMDRFGHSVK